MTNRYPWYEVVEGDILEQGDLLLRCPVVVPIFSGATPGRTIEGYIDTFDLVIMTQSCDLVNEKTQEVILCPHWSLTDARDMDPSFGKKGALEDIGAGKRFRYALLNLSEQDELAMEVRIVDFGRIFSLPKDFVGQFAANGGKRLRLCPPYREHLSQAFARFFMRVGLPQDIELPR